MKGIVVRNSVFLNYSLPRKARRLIHCGVASVFDANDLLERLDQLRLRVRLHFTHKTALLSLTFRSAWTEQRTVFRKSSSLVGFVINALAPRSKEACWSFCVRDEVKIAMGTRSNREFVRTVLRTSNP